MVEGRRAGRSSIGSAFAALFCVGVSTAATAWDDPQWVRQLGTSEWDFSNDVATDGEGDVYISGWTLGPLGGTHKGGADAWLAKYSAAGALLWKRQLGSSADDGLGRVKVATNGVGNVCISFDGANEGAAGSWLAAYSAGGRLLWTRHLATSLYDPGGIATDADRSIYVSGSTFGS